MKFKCDKCSKPATIHLTEIIDGEKIEKHLCQDCAATEGITVKAEVPISQLLEDFILQTGIEATADAAEATEARVLAHAWEELRQSVTSGLQTGSHTLQNVIH